MMTTQSGDGRAHLHLLTGAYAADALSDPEREEFEQHLAGCADCTQEVRELRATGARLAGAVAEAPPPGLRDRVLAEIATVRQDPPVVDELERRRRSTRRWTSRLLGVAAAILLVVSLSLSALTISLDRRLDQLEADNDEVTAVVAAPDAQVLPARPGGDGSALVVLSRSRGEAVFVASGLAATGADQTYQLWLLGPGSQPRSAGLLALQPGGKARQLLDGDPAGANGVALTVERAGGAPAPTTEPVVVVDLA